MTSIIQSLTPKTIKTYESDFHGTIEIQQFLGKYSIAAGTLTQSGGLVEQLWRKGIKYLVKKVFFSKKNYPQEVLILGLGGGSMVKHIYHAWLKSQITAIEIDPIMIKLGKKYFNIQKYNNLSIIIDDVHKWLESNRKQQFDLVLVDLYQGNSIPTKAQSTQFFKSTKTVLKPGGVALFNRFTLEGQEKEALLYKKRLESVYSQVIRIPTQVNWLLMAS